MATQSAGGQRPLHTADIAVYGIGLVVGLTATHLVIGVFNDGRMTSLAVTTLAAVGLFMAAFMYVRRAALMRWRHAHYFLHVIAFLLVNATFLAHAGVLYAMGREEVIQESWQGVLFSMPLVWSVGLLVHTLATVFSRGYEHVEV